MPLHVSPLARGLAASLSETVPEHEAAWGAVCGEVGVDIAPGCGATLKRGTGEIIDSQGYVGGWLELFQKEAAGGLEN